MRTTGGVWMELLRTRIAKLFWKNLFFWDWNIWPWTHQTSTDSQKRIRFAPLMFIKAAQAILSTPMKKGRPANDKWAFNENWKAVHCWCRIRKSQILHRIVVQGGCRQIPHVNLGVLQLRGQSCRLVHWLSLRPVQWLSLRLVQWLSCRFVQWPSCRLVQWLSLRLVHWLSLRLVQWLSCRLVQQFSPFFN